ncbi:unnamed protein product, partial [Pylaiella littoralis]
TASRRAYATRPMQPACTKRPSPMDSRPRQRPRPSSWRLPTTNTSPASLHRARTRGFGGPNRGRRTSHEAAHENSLRQRGPAGQRSDAHGGGRS